MGLEVLEAFCVEKGMPLSPVQVAAFLDFRSRLYELNEVMNLTRVPFDECETRHFIDSLLIAPLIPEGALVLDIGAGAGFPSWPLACARPDLKVTAMDSSNKAGRAVGLVPLPNLRFKPQRGEDVTNRESYDVVTGRAFAPFTEQLEVSAAWAKVGGAVIPFRTHFEEGVIKSFVSEVLGLVLEREVTCELQGTDAVRYFPVFRKTAKTQRTYPRTWAQIKKRPL
jgi:16S rRNA (guanine527-N7)-methyltransferase